MTGISEWNFPAFHAAAAKLRAIGHDVTNPAENDDGDTSMSWDYYMRQDIAHIMSVEGVAVLPGWQGSRGARLELLLASSLRLPIFEAETMIRIKPSLVVEVHDD